MLELRWQLLLCCRRGLLTWRTQRGTKETLRCFVPLPADPITVAKLHLDCFQMKAALALHCAYLGIEL
ncbi:uncharacterized [Tachysurus ichikawai]